MLISNERTNSAQKSRYCEKFILTDSTSEADMLDRLLQLKPLAATEIILPVTTEGFQFASRNQSLLSERFHVPPLSAIESLVLASDKWRLFDFASRNDLPVLHSTQLTDSTVKAIESGELQMTFPALLKPKNREGGQGFHKLNTAGELRQLWKALKRDAEDEYIIQPFVDGKDASLALYCENGTIKSHALWKAEFYGKQRYTIPLCIQFTQNDRVLQLGKRLVELLNWQGVCDIDFFVDNRTGEIWLLEVNARFWGNVIACETCGINFPLLMCQAALSKQALNWPAQTNDTLYCYPKGIPRLLKEPSKYLAILKSPLRMTGINTVLRDPRPELYRLRRKIMRLFRARPGKTEFSSANQPTVLEHKRRMKASRNITLNHIVGITFLTLQLLLIVYARFTPERFFCWAPYDERAHYEIDIHIDGRQLSPKEITTRYHYPSLGWEPRSIHNVISMARQYEATYGAQDNASVIIHYEKNGRPQQTWTWPQP